MFQCMNAISRGGGTFRQCGVKSQLFISGGKNASCVGNWRVTE